MGRVGTRRSAALLRALILVLICSALPVTAGGMPGAAAQVVGVRVPVLAYHNVDYSGMAHSVTPEQLDAQCRWLMENGYTAITLGQFWDAAMGFGQLPPNPVVLTNDDGWASATIFADILGRYGMVGTYFINNDSPLTLDQIVSLSYRGGVEAHTATHPNLSGLDFETQYAEIAQNKAYIEQITGQPVRFLAWPFGDSDANAVQAAAAAGIVAAFGLNGTAANTAALDPYYIPRIMMMIDDDLAMFAAKVASW